MCGVATYFITNLFNNHSNIRSSNPKNTAVAKLTATTTAVYWIIWFLVGQLTFDNSCLTSLRNWVTFSIIICELRYFKLPTGQYLSKEYHKTILFVKSWRFGSRNEASSTPEELCRLPDPLGHRGCLLLDICGQ